MEMDLVTPYHRGKAAYRRRQEPTDAQYVEAQGTLHGPAHKGKKMHDGAIWGFIHADNREGGGPPPSKKARSSKHIEGGDKDSNQEGKDKDQDNEEESDPLHANSIEEYYGKRVFIFLHHFAGPNDPLSAEIQKEATAAGIKVKCISVEKSSGTGDLLQDEPYNTHLGCAHNGTLMHTTQGLSFHARPFRNFDSGLQRD